MFSARSQRRDVEWSPMPQASTAAELEELRRWATSEARRAMAWYQLDKRFKRDGSRLLRALSIVLAAAGCLAPLLRDSFGGGALSWGYVLLAAAVACLAFDRFFGLSRAWVRDVTMINSIQRKLVEFELDWAAPNFRPADGVDTDEARFALVRRFRIDLADLLDGEAAEWRTEFHSGPDRPAAEEQGSMAAL